MKVSKQQDVQAIAELATRPARASRLLRVVVTANAIVLLGAFAALLVTRGTTSPEAEVARVSSFVTDARTARFTGSGTSQYGDGTDDVGSTSIDRSRLEGQISVPDMAHMIEDDGEFVYEIIYVPEGEYYRENEARADLEDEQWVFLARDPEVAKDAEAEAEPVDAEQQAFASVGAIASSFNTPLDLPDMFSKLTKIERLDDGRLRGTLKLRDFLPPEAVEMFEKIAAEDPEEAEFLPDLENGRVMITITDGDGGRLDRLVVEIRETTDGEQFVDTADLIFTNWGEPVSITAPTADAIDHTPEIDEEELAAFDKFQILAPTTLPAGWELHSAYVSEQDDEYEECTSVELMYGPPFDWESIDDDELPPITTITMYDAECPWIDDYAADSDDGRTVTFGPHRGHVLDPRNVTGDGEFVLVTAALPGMRLEATSIAGEKVLLDLLATLAPYHP